MNEAVVAGTEEDEIFWGVEASVCNFSLMMQMQPPSLLASSFLDCVAAPIPMRSYNLMTDSGWDGLSPRCGRFCIS